jgi:hypothetical protein
LLRDPAFGRGIRRTSSTINPFRRPDGSDDPAVIEAVIDALHFSPNAMLDKGRNLSSATLARQAPFRQLAKDLSRA